MVTKASLKQFILYGIIGGAAAVLDYGAFYLFKTKLPDMSAETASIIGQAIGFIFSFSLNTFFNFRKTDRLFRRFISYLTICLIGMTISTLMIYILKPYINIYTLKFGCLVFVSLLQFFLNKFITYK